MLSQVLSVLSSQRLMGWQVLWEHHFQNHLYERQKKDEHARLKLQQKDEDARLKLQIEAENQRMFREEVKDWLYGKTSRDYTTAMDEIIAYARKYGEKNYAKHFARTVKEPQNNETGDTEKKQQEKEKQEKDNMIDNRRIAKNYWNQALDLKEEGLLERLKGRERELRLKHDRFIQYVKPLDEKLEGQEYVGGNPIYKSSIFMN